MDCLAIGLKELRKKEMYLLKNICGLYYTQRNKPVSKKIAVGIREDHSLINLFMFTLSDHCCYKVKFFIRK